MTTPKSNLIYDVIDPARVKALGATVARYKNRGKRSYAEAFLLWMLHEGPEPDVGEVSTMTQQAVRRTIHEGLTGARPGQKCAWAYCRRCRGLSADMARIDP